METNSGNIICGQNIKFCQMPDQAPSCEGVGRWRMALGEWSVSTLTPREELTVPIRWEVGWVTKWRRQTSPGFACNRTSVPQSSIQYVVVKPTELSLPPISHIPHLTGFFFCVRCLSNYKPPYRWSVAAATKSNKCEVESKM